MSRVLTTAVASFCLLIGSNVASAQTLAAGRTIRSKAIISESDLVLLQESVPGALTKKTEAAGLEARTILYPGRPIRPADVGPPAIVTRNQVVAIIFQGHA